MIMTRSVVLSGFSTEDEIKDNGEKRNDRKR